MTRKEHIKSLQYSLSKGLDDCMFHEAHPIDYINEYKKKEQVVVDLYEERNQLVIFIDNKLCEKIQMQLIHAGFIPVEHIYNPDEVKNGDAFLMREDSFIQIHGGYNPGHSDDTAIVKDPVIETDSLNNQNDINDLIGKSPGWLLRSGITILFFVIGVIITFSAFIKYPDKITSTGVITSNNPPIELYSKVNARVESILAPSGTRLSEGDPIIYFKNTIKLKDVNLIKDLVFNFNPNDIKQVLSIKLPDNISLGNMQQPYGQLNLKVKEFQQIIRSTGAENQIQNIQEEIQNIELLRMSLEEERQLYVKERRLLEKDLGRQTELFTEGVISELELEQKEKEINQFVREYESLNKNSIESDIRQESLESSILRISEERTRQLYQYQFEIASIIEVLRTDILEWEDTFFLRAEIDGIIELSDEINTKTMLGPQTLIGYVNPDVVEQKYARVLIPPQRRGEIAVGNKCLLKLDAYPYKEFGLIESNIGSLSVLSTKKTNNMINLYEVLIPLEEELITEYNRVLNYSPNMSLTAEIITEEKTLLARVFNRFYDLIKNN